MEKYKRKIKGYLYLDAWQRWEYKHTTFVIVSLILFILLLDTSFMVTAFDTLSKLGYAGVFIGGVLFVSVFTAVPAVVLLISFTDLNPVLLSMVAGLGAMVGDFIILQFVEDKVAYELKPIAYKFKIPQAISYLQGRKSTLGLVRLIGAFIIASPLPDEIGIGLLGMGKLNKISFLLTCYLLNTVGILLIVLTARAL